MRVARATDNDILKTLEEQKSKEGTLPELLEFYQKLLQIQTRIGQRIDVPNPSFSTEVISEHAQQGKPLITFDELALDWSLLHDTFIEVTATFAEHAELFDLTAKELEESAPDNLLTPEAVKAWFEGARLSSAIPVKDADEALLKNIIHASLKPFLVNYSRALLGSVDQENWRQGYCPICGGNPDIAFLETERGARWLVCSRCDAEWLFQRLECPYCRNKDQSALSYFTDDEGLYRLYLCDQCKHYLKTVDLRKAKSEVLIPLERVLTLDIDRQAQEYGYSPCNGDGQTV